MNDAVHRLYTALAKRTASLRRRLGRDLILAEKVLYAHLDRPESADIEGGGGWIDLRPDRVAMQDATAQMALLQFMQAGRKRVAVPSTVHCDHLIRARLGAGLVAAPQQPHYTAAKHGVLGLMKTAAKEYAAQNIRVNSVCPGVIDTPMIRGFIGGRPEVEKMLVSTLPAGCLGRPEEVAEAVVWLCSDAASFFSGESLLVNAATLCI